MRDCQPRSLFLIFFFMHKGLKFIKNSSGELKEGGRKEKGQGVKNSLYKTGIRAGQKAKHQKHQSDRQAESLSP